MEWITAANDKGNNEMIPKAVHKSPGVRVPFEGMTGRTAPSSDGLLAEVFWGFPQL